MKLVFVRMYGSTIIGVVGPPYLYCSPVAFCAFAWLRLCAFGASSAFGASGVCKIFSLKKKFETALITSFTLLLNLSYYGQGFLNHNLF